MLRRLQRRSRRGIRKERGVAEISEFVLALYILIPIVTLPLINFGFLLTGAAIQYLATNDCVAKASTQPDFPTALTAMTSEAWQFQTLGLAKFIAFNPQGGYGGCGDDLTVVTTNLASGSVLSSQPNAPLATNIDTGSNVYEMSVKSTYSIPPLINFSSVPVLDGVPGLGRPTVLTFTASRPVEHPGGLTSSSISNNGGIITAFVHTGNSGNTPVAISNTTWNNPTIFDQIKAAGQTVVSVNVFTVLAANPSWTPSGVSLTAGEKVWIDTQAVGQWSSGVLQYYPLTDANGRNLTQANFVSPNLPAGSLIGQFGTGGTPFLVGDTLINYSPATIGALSMIMNDAPDSYGDNSGQQMIRVVVTK